MSVPQGLEVATIRVDCNRVTTRVDSKAGVTAAPVGRTDSSEVNKRK